MPDVSDPGQTLTIAGALVIGLPAAGALIRSGLKLIANALNRSSSVIEKNSAAFADLKEMLGRVDVRTQDAHGRVVEIHREISDVHEIPMAAIDDKDHGPKQPPVIVSGGEYSFGRDDDEPTPVDSPIPKKRRARTNPKQGQ